MGDRRSAVLVLAFFSAYLELSDDAAVMLSSCTGARLRLDRRTSPSDGAAYF